MTKLAMFAAAALIAAAPAVAKADDDETGGAYLGVRLQRVEGGLAEALEMKADSGVLLAQVLDDSPAAKAGLHGGDIVVKLDGQAVGSPAELRSAIESKKAGETVTIDYLRNGKPMTAQATLRETPESEEGGLARGFAQVRPGIDHLRRRLGSVRDMHLGREHGWLGVYTQPMTGQLGEYFGTKEGGALVAEVVDASPAAKLGLKAGDVIVKIDDQKIEDPEDLRRVVGGHDEPADVELTWVREHHAQHGKTKLEVREGLGMLDAPEAPMPSNHNGGPGPGDDLDMRQRVRAFGMRAHDDTDRALQELREQVKRLQEQVQKLERKMN
ncbi:MAG: PDZ domain-containing protein [bacterium]